VGVPVLKRIGISFLTLVLLFLRGIEREG